MSMKFTTVMIVFLIFALAILTGCAQRESRVTDFYGISYELAKFNQIYDMDAGKKNVGPVDSHDGKAAAAVVKSYQDSFKTKQEVTKVRMGN